MDRGSTSRGSSGKTVDPSNRLAADLAVANSSNQRSQGRSSQGLYHEADPTKNYSEFNDYDKKRSLEYRDVKVEASSPSLEAKNTRDVENARKELRQGPTPYRTYVPSLPSSVKTADIDSKMNENWQNQGFNSSGESTLKQPNPAMTMPLINSYPLVKETDSNQPSRVDGTVLSPRYNVADLSLSSSGKPHSRSKSVDPRRNEKTLPIEKDEVSRVDGSQNGPTRRRLSITPKRKGSDADYSLINRVDGKRKEVVEWTEKTRISRPRDVRQMPLKPPPPSRSGSRSHATGPVNNLKHSHEGVACGPGGSGRPRPPDSRAPRCREASPNPKIRSDLQTDTGDATVPKEEETVNASAKRQKFDQQISPSLGPVDGPVTRSKNRTRSAPLDLDCEPQPIEQSEISENVESENMSIDVTENMSTLGSSHINDPCESPQLTATGSQECDTATNQGNRIQHSSVHGAESTVLTTDINDGNLVASCNSEQEEGKQLCATVVNGSNNCSRNVPEAEEIEIPSAQHEIPADIRNPNHEEGNTCSQTSRIPEQRAADTTIDTGLTHEQSISTIDAHEEEISVPENEKSFTGRETSADYESENAACDGYFEKNTNDEEGTALKETVPEQVLLVCAHSVELFTESTGPDDRGVVHKEGSLNQPISADSEYANEEEAQKRMAIPAVGTATLESEENTTEPNELNGNLGPYSGRMRQRTEAQPEICATTLNNPQPSSGPESEGILVQVEEHPDNRQSSREDGHVCSENSEVPERGNADTNTIDIHCVCASKQSITAGGNLFNARVEGIIPEKEELAIEREAVADSVKLRADFGACQEILGTDCVGLAASGERGGGIDFERTLLPHQESTDPTDSVEKVEDGSERYIVSQGPAATDVLQGRPGVRTDGATLHFKEDADAAPNKGVLEMPYREVKPDVLEDMIHEDLTLYNISDATEDVNEIAVTNQRYGPENSLNRAAGTEQRSMTHDQLPILDDHTERGDSRPDEASTCPGTGTEYAGGDKQTSEKEITYRPTDPADINCRSGEDMTDDPEPENRDPILKENDIVWGEVLESNDSLSVINFPVAPISSSELEKNDLLMDTNYANNADAVALLTSPPTVTPSEYGETLTSSDLVKEIIPTVEEITCTGPPTEPLLSIAAHQGGESYVTETRVNIEEPESDTDSKYDTNNRKPPSLLYAFFSSLFKLPIHMGLWLISVCNWVIFGLCSRTRRLLGRTGSRIPVTDLQQRGTQERAPIDPSREFGQSRGLQTNGNYGYGSVPQHGARDDEAREERERQKKRRQAVEDETRRRAKEEEEKREKEWKEKEKAIKERDEQEKRAKKEEERAREEEARRGRQRAEEEAERDRVVQTICGLLEGGRLKNVLDHYKKELIEELESGSIPLDRIEKCLENPGDIVERDGIVLQYFYKFHKAHQLRELFMESIARWAETVLSHSEFKKLCFEEVKEILSMDTLCAHEITVLRAAMTWLREPVKNWDSRTHHRKDVMGLIRFGSMSLFDVHLEPLVSGGKDLEKIVKRILTDNTGTPRWSSLDTIPLSLDEGASPVFCSQPQRGSFELHFSVDRPVKFASFFIYNTLSNSARIHPETLEINWSLYRGIDRVSGPFNNIECVTDNCERPAIASGNLAVKLEPGKEYLLVASFSLAVKCFECHPDVFVLSDDRYATPDVKLDIQKAFYGYRENYTKAYKSKLNVTPFSKLFFLSCV